MDALGSYTWAAVALTFWLQSMPMSYYSPMRATSSGGITIPTTTVPTHWMQNGNAFLAAFQDLQGERSASVAAGYVATIADSVAFPMKLLVRYQSLQWPPILVNKLKKAHQCQVPVLMKGIYKVCTFLDLPRSPDTALKMDDLQRHPL